ncbi:DUF3644 domain-containing protein [Fastidiosipila sanguinis]|uniref:DUF3644 domain-containing protein n=1 Tax=Fastidiosipila sanguinis TaxID=236753 RepID=A0A2S0KPC2_9FIRM|nr:DUF3644 domain-containing protein [Fastidiosipila sanguinis]AVM42854.1 DUF3644 domain-containing protein [Fastidiosipila sanguinis]
MNNDDLIKRLVDKSIEAFLMGLEVYNKPTIKYRIEGFSFFICNAWELMLKAELIKKDIPIYYKNNPDRTLNISECISKIYPDKNTRIRLNLEKIVELRNTSTHFITEDYEVKYVGLFQACVLNYSNELQNFHNENILEYIPQNFLTITPHFKALNNEEIKIKYPVEIAEKLIERSNSIDVLSDEINSDKFSIQVNQNLYITRDRSNADFTLRITKDSEKGVAIVKDLKDPSDTHKYSYSNVITAVQERMKKKNLKIDYEKGFNTYVFQLFIDFYNIKSEPKYTYRHTIGNNSQYTYSQTLVDFIIGMMEQDPNNFVKSLVKNKKR